MSYARGFSWVAHTLGQRSAVFLGSTSSSSAAVAALAAGGSLLYCNNLWDSTTTTTASNTASCEAASKVPGANLKKRMTAIGHFSMLSETSWNPSIATILITLQGQQPFHAQDFVNQWKQQSMAERHARFQWKVATADGDSGHFDATDQAHFDLPVREGLAPVPGKERQDILARIAHLQLTAWDLTKSLWNVQVIPFVKQSIDALPPTDDDDDKTPKSKKPVSANIVPPQQQAKEKAMVRSVLLWQSHHVLADGVSLSAALLDLSDEADKMRKLIKQEIQKRKDKSKGKTFWQRLYQQFLLFAWFVLGSMRALLYQAKLLLFSLIEANPWHTLHRLVNPQEPHRTLSCTRVGTVDQAKWVAGRLSRGNSRITVNDIFVAAVTGALARQLHQHRERLRAQQPVEADDDDEDQTDDKKLLALQKHMNVVVPVHLKGGVLLPDESVGNNIGAFCAVVPGEGDIEPAERVHRVHSSLMEIKQSPAALLSYAIANMFARFLPSSWASYAFRRANAGATVVVTNVKGPESPLHYQGRTVESVYGFIPIPPGIPVGVTIMSYQGKICMGLTAESWAVPDGDQFMRWVLEEYRAMIQAARESVKP